MSNQEDFEKAVLARAEKKGESPEIARHVLTRATDPQHEVSIEFSDEDGEDYRWSSFKPHVLFPSLAAMDAFIYRVVRGSEFSFTLVSRFPYETYRVMEHEGETYEIPVKKTIADGLRAIHQLADYCQTSSLVDTVGYIDMVQMIALDLDAFVLDGCFDDADNPEALEDLLRLIVSARTRNIYIVAYASEVSSGHFAAQLFDHIETVTDIS